MTFVRPEIRAGLNRWREAIAGVCVSGLGLWWTFVTGGLLFYLGLVLIPVGFSFTALGVQRARLRTGSVGPGIVQIDEGRVIYFGPLTGGVADLDSLTRIEINPGGRPAHWLLHRPGEEVLGIPVSANGAEQLLDAFSILPGFQSARAVAAMRQTGQHALIIWQRGRQDPALPLMP
ncbi:MAG: hypothetical protein AAGA28_03585 [Pseudomonadota bacterium]